MNKAELINEISKNVEDVPKVQIDKILNGFMEAVKDGINKGEKITLVGFGTLEVREKKSTTGVNPKTREKIKIPSKKVLKFKTSDVVNEKLNPKKK